jgi:hypothetical protein
MFYNLLTLPFFICWLIITILIVVVVLIRRHKYLNNIKFKYNLDLDLDKTNILVTQCNLIIDNNETNRDVYVLFYHSQRSKLKNIVNGFDPVSFKNEFFNLEKVRYYTLNSDHSTRYANNSQDSQAYIDYVDQMTYYIADVKKLHNVNYIILPRKAHLGNNSLDLSNMSLGAIVFAQDGWKDSLQYCFKQDYFDLYKECNSIYFI